VSETRLVFLPKPELVYDSWPRLEPLFRIAVDEAVHGEFTLASLLALGLNNVGLFAYIEDDKEILMALAMEVRRYPNMAVLNVMAMAGQRMSELFAQHSPAIADFARSIGMSHFEASGSKAMARALRSCGWEFVYETVRYKL
jgi:hypothetical protein